MSSLTLCTPPPHHPRLQALRKIASNSLQAWQQQRSSVINGRKVRPLNLYVFISDKILSPHLFLCKFRMLHVTSANYSYYVESFICLFIHTKLQDLSICHSVLLEINIIDSANVCICYSKYWKCSKTLMFIANYCNFPMCCCNQLTLLVEHLCYFKPVG